MRLSLPTKIEQLALEKKYSGVISIEVNSVVAYRQAFGFADRANRIANRIDTRFGIASGTKGFTAVAIGKLIEAGLIELDTPLHVCISVDLPKIDKEVTIKHLLSHTSGVADYFDEELVTDAADFFVDIPWYQLEGPKDYIPLFIDEEMKFSPGARFSYSNGGYILLGVVVEEVSGQPFQHYVEEEIFAPCGMVDSGLFSMNRLPGNTAQGYIDGDDGWRTNIFNLPIVGASDGGAFTTCRDMRRFWAALLDHHLVGKDLMRQFHQPQSAVTDGASYGLGFWLGRNSVHLEGYDAGISFKSLWCEEKKMLVTLLANTAPGVWPLAALIEAELL